MPITIPIAIATDADKVKFLYRVLELLRLEYNKGGMPETELRQKTEKIFAILNPIKQSLGMFQISPEKTPDDIRLAYKPLGKLETKWDGDINLTKI